jgi:hypothetical protein
MKQPPWSDWALTHSCRLAMPPRVLLDLPGELEHHQSPARNIRQGSAQCRMFLPNQRIAANPDYGYDFGRSSSTARCSLTGPAIAKCPRLMWNDSKERRAFGCAMSGTLQTLTPRFENAGQKPCNFLVERLFQGKRTYATIIPPVYRRMTVFELRWVCVSLR